MDEKKQILSAVTDYIKTTGQLPEGPTLKQCGTTIWKIKRLFGNWHNMIAEIDPAIINQSKRLRAINELQNKLVSSNLSLREFKKHGGNHGIIYKSFNNWDEALEAAFPAEIVLQWKSQRYSKHGHYNRTTKKRRILDVDYSLLQLPAPKKEQKYSLLSVVEEIEQYYLSNKREITLEKIVDNNPSLNQAILYFGGWKKVKALTRISEYEKTKILEQFKQEVSDIIAEYGYFSMKLHKAKPGTLHHTKLRDMFGSLAQLRAEAGLDIPVEAYTYRGAYSEKEYSDFLWKIYHKYGFISISLIENEPNHIRSERIRKHFGSLEAACKHFGVPYKAPAHRSKFYFEIETKACNYLQIPCIQEKTWPWLKYKSRLRCDLFFPLLNLVIEIDGPQHYKNFRFFNESDEIYYTALKRDQIKNEELPKHGIDLIRINSKNVKQIEEILRPFREKRDLIYALCAF